MKINVGSKNPVKIRAVKELTADYYFLKGAEVVSVEADAMVSDQPLSMKETIKGAKNRARSAFLDCDLSFGLESGLIKAPGTITNYLNFTICAIYDGKDYYFGSSSGFELPPKAMELILNQDYELDSAVYKTGLTKKPRVGYTDKGFVGLLTNGRVTRKEYAKQAVVMALIYLENKKYLI